MTHPLQSLDRRNPSMSEPACSSREAIYQFGEPTDHRGRLRLVMVVRMENGQAVMSAATAFCIRGAGLSRARIIQADPDPAEVNYSVPGPERCAELARLIFPQFDS